MNYKNGRVVKMGDCVVGNSHNRPLITGHIIGIQEKVAQSIGQPAIAEYVKVLTHVRNPDHPDASTATFNTVHDFADPAQLLHAQDLLNLQDDTTGKAEIK